MEEAPCISGSHKCENSKDPEIYPLSILGVFHIIES